MMSNFSHHRYLWIVPLVFLVACGKQTAIAPIETPTPAVTLQTTAPTSTPIPIDVTPSHLPTESLHPSITPDLIQIEKWMEYENALAMVLLPPNPLRGEVLCEWEILGQTNQQVFVWAFCQSPPYSEDLPPSIASIPAVINLERDGTVASVKIPGSGTSYATDVREMFPVDVQQRIFNQSVDTIMMKIHIELRRENPGPPLIILSPTPMP